MGNRSTRARTFRTTIGTGCRRSGESARRSQKPGRNAGTRSRRRVNNSRPRSPRRRSRFAARDPARSIPTILDRAFQGVRSQFEPRYGGFGRAPKFPQAMTIDFLCRAYVRNRSDETLTMITTSLDAMAARRNPRSSRRRFRAVLHRRHVARPALREDALRQRVAHPRICTAISSPVRFATATWSKTSSSTCLRDMHSPESGFYSAEDADSEGVEGKFYCWSIDEIREVCGADADAVIAYFGVTPEGNFVDPHTGFRGNILHVAGRNAVPPVEVERAKSRLLERRRIEGSTRTRRQGPARVERARCWTRSPRPRPCSIAPTGWTPPEPMPGSS